MKLFKKISEIKEQVKTDKRHNLNIGLVPTMGALHTGHESLIKRARQECDIIVVSIFVNPIQFGPNEDFDKYPRQLKQDMQICETNGVNYIFAPGKDEMYPDEHRTVVVPPEHYQDRLCGKSRPGHFNGVATVVTKLFNIIEPDIAYFGEKDAQQLTIIKKMVRDLNISVKIVSCPTIREADGLALSSRNKYLDHNARAKALTLYKTLQMALKTNDLDNAKCELHPDVELEYLEKVELGNDRFIAIAAQIDGVRLIDNIKI